MNFKRQQSLKNIVSKGVPTHFLATNDMKMKIYDYKKISTAWKKHKAKLIDMRIFLEGHRSLILGL